MKKYAWATAGWLCLIMAYIGVVTPGIPFSHFVLGAAFCFAKSSPRMHKWITEHKTFGLFINNWTEKKVFPQKAKYLMAAMMTSSLVIMYFTVPIKGVIYTGIFMFLVCIWGWRYPGSPEEYDRRKAAGKRIAWIR